MDGDNLKKILDDRTPFQGGRNYHISKHNEKVAMEGLTAVLRQSYGINNVAAEPIDSEEEWLDGKIHVKPDYFVDVAMQDRKEVKRFTIEVKTTYYDSFLNDEIIIKAPQVWTCKNERKKYPNPYVFAATEKVFALIPMGSFWNTPPQEIDFSKGIKKKGFLLNCNEYEWHNFLVPLRFKNKENYGYNKKEA